MDLMRICSGVSLYITYFLFLLKTKLSLHSHAASSVGGPVLVIESTKLQSEKVLSWELNNSFSFSSPYIFKYSKWLLEQQHFYATISSPCVSKSIWVMSLAFHPPRSDLRPCLFSSCLFLPSLQGKLLLLQSPFCSELRVFYLLLGA